MAEDVEILRYGDTRFRLSNLQEQLEARLRSVEAFIEYDKDFHNQTTDGSPLNRRTFIIKYCTLLCVSPKATCAEIDNVYKNFLIKHPDFLNLPIKYKEMIRSAHGQLVELTNRFGGKLKGIYDEVFDPNFKGEFFSKEDKVESRIASLELCSDYVDYYGILDVSMDASPEQINEAYERTKGLALRQSAPGDVVELVEEAYSILSDPKERGDYDRFVLNSCPENAVIIDPDELGLDLVPRNGYTLLGDDTLKERIDDALNKMRDKFPPPSIQEIGEPHVDADPTLYDIPAVSKPSSNRSGDTAIIDTRFGSAKTDPRINFDGVTKVIDLKEKPVKGHWVVPLGVSALLLLGLYGLGKLSEPEDVKEDLKDNGNIVYEKVPDEEPSEYRDYFVVKGGDDDVSQGKKNEDETGLIKKSEESYPLESLVTPEEFEKAGIVKSVVVEVDEIKPGDEKPVGSRRVIEFREKDKKEIDVDRLE